ncbi:MAG: tRNA 5-methoxyuridine(34)/uridine 5-oxyacetic acid(34) synthase CmoB [Marinagarivorans sp.]|nr:tRNA 5-methoxyuridine(34)/uridine 5-oxyacetic acid(34) synthase CmoB [Marinagarivorans sp.]
MINYNNLIKNLQNTLLAPLAEVLPPLVTASLCPERHGDIATWSEALASSPNIENVNFDVQNGVSIGNHQTLTSEQNQQLNASLQALKPWRKGPFDIFGTHIDTEWRSDWKWERLINGITPLEGRTVLDVGCGSGYHCWRMWGAGASRVIGIDPTPLFIVQFHQIKKYIGLDVPVDLLPLGIEHLPANLNAFDTTFCMGVLYHRRSPIDCLRELKDTLKMGGELVLETLITDGPEGYSLMPEGRYAKMGNVWFLPSIKTLELWLRRTGFGDIRVVDVNVTSTDEQRSTEWMTFLSLKDFLDPTDATKTCEGYPAPKRAILVATKIKN